MNPELRRNLWLQFSPLRLLLAPLAIGAFLLLVWLVSHSFSALSVTAESIYFLLVLLWGTRRAADLVSEEIAGGTWDSQRMSALGAWQMSWGKLLGGTSYVWYAAGLAFAAYVGARWAAGYPASAPGEAIRLLRMLATGLFGQAVALLASLAPLRRQGMRRRLGVGLSQIAGILAAAVATGHVDPGLFFSPMPQVSWYGRVSNGEGFALASLLAFLGWSIFGVYRLMRLELRFRSGPWAGLAFTVFLMAYGNGFLYPVIEAAGGGLDAWLSFPFLLTVALTYVAVFIEPKEVMRYRWLGTALAQGHLRRAQALLPQWLPVFALALAFAILLAGSGGLARLEGLIGLVGFAAHLGALQSAAGNSLYPLAIVFYLLRDLLLVLYFNFGSRRQRGDATAFICLLLVYFPAMGILLALNLYTLLPLLAPYLLANPLVILAVPLAEVAGLGLLVLGRLNRAGRFAAAPAVA